MLTRSEMNNWIDEHRPAAQDYFRLETLEAYSTPAEAPIFDAWRAGGPIPDNPAHTEWLAHIGRETARQQWRKVHIVAGPLSPYEQFHLEYGLALNTAAGEQNRVLEVPDREHLVSNVGDFYMLDRRLILAMLYQPDGTFRGAEEVTGRAAGALVVVADLAWERAVPLPEWRAAHPEYRTAASFA